MNSHVIWPSRAAVQLALGVICLVIPPRHACALEPTAIAWRDDYATAMEDARATNRLLWIQFTGPWCPNCTRMERDSFPSPTIIEHSERSFVPLKLRSDVNSELVAALNLTAIPATVIVAPNRDIISFHQGYLGPEELDGLLRESQARFAPEPAAQRPTAKPEEGSARPAEKKREQESIAREELAVAGYCAVSLVEERKLVKGRREHAVAHEGRTYYFSSVGATDRFRLQPERYVPWSGGACPVTQLERGLTRPGDPRRGVLYAGRLFLCASEEDRRRFVANPDRFGVEQVAHDGSAVPGSHSRAISTTK